MRRLLITLVLIVVAAAGGYKAGLDARESGYKAMNDQVLVAQKAAVDAKQKASALANEKKSLEQENERAIATASQLITDFKQSTLDASGQIAGATSKVLSKDQLADRLIELGSSLKER